MRKTLNYIFGEELRYLAIDTREKLELTQKEMGRRLEMSESSYSDIETGRSYPGMVSTLLLLGMQNDPKTFLQKLKAKADLRYDKEVSLV